MLARNRLISLKILGAVFLGVAVGATAAVWIFPPRAAAVTCTGAVNVEATDNALWSHRGMGVANPGMYVYDYDAVCDHVSSVGVLGANGNLVEIGWDDIDNNWQACNVTGDDNPYLFTVEVRNDGYHCSQFLQLTPSQSDGFGAADQNGDSTWSFTWEGAPIGQQLDEGFNSGLVSTNGERHNSSESARALFDGTRYMASDGWHSWSVSHCYVDENAEWNNQLVSATKVKVTTEARQC